MPFKIFILRPASYVLWHIFYCDSLNYDPISQSGGMTQSHNLGVMTQSHNLGVWPNLTIWGYDPISQSGGYDPISQSGGLTQSHNLWGMTQSHNWGQTDETIVLGSVNHKENYDMWWMKYAHTGLCNLCNVSTSLVLTKIRCLLFLTDTLQSTSKSIKSF